MASSALVFPDQRVIDLCKRLGLDPAKTGKLTIVMEPMSIVHAVAEIYMDDDDLSAALVAIDTDIPIEIRSAAKGD